MGVLSLKRVDGLLAITRVHLPAAVRSDGEFEDWNVIAPALIAIAADLLEGIVGAVPPRGRVRAEILARSLAEYVIVFAWLAAAQDEAERDARLRQVVRDEFLEREKAANKLEDQIAGRDRYAGLFDPQKRSGGPLPTELLDDVTRQRLEELKADPAIKRTANTFDMAFKADQRWIPEIDLVAHNPFALIYFTLFTGPSFVTHPSPSAIGKVVVGTPPNLIVGLPEPLGESESPYGQAMLTFVNMLLVASRSLGWPNEAAVRAVLERA